MASIKKAAGWGADAAFDTADNDKNYMLVIGSGQLIQLLLKVFRPKQYQFIFKLLLLNKLSVSISIYHLPVRFYQCTLSGRNREMVKSSRSSHDTVLKQAELIANELAIRIG